MKKERQVLIFSDSYSLAIHLVNEFTNLAQESIDISGRFMTAFSGGKSPVEFLCQLSNVKNFDLWKSTHIFQADERFVPFDNSKNNFRMIDENLLNYTNVPTENIHRFNTELETVGESAEDYKIKLIKGFKLAMGEWPRFDFMLLGLGEDGHTASIFPEITDQEQEMRFTLPVTLNYLDQERVSLTLPLINKSRNIFVIAKGKSKAQIVKQILDQNADLPANKLCPEDGRITFLLDKAAASELTVDNNYTLVGEAISIIR